MKSFEQSVKKPIIGIRTMLDDMALAAKPCGRKWTTVLVSMSLPKLSRKLEEINLK